jgi:hypothetical protein
MVNKSKLDLWPKDMSLTAEAPKPFVRKPGEYRLQ